MYIIHYRGPIQSRQAMNRKVKSMSKMWDWRIDPWNPFNAKKPQHRSIIELSLSLSLNSRVEIAWDRQTPTSTLFFCHNFRVKVIFSRKMRFSLLGHYLTNYQANWALISFLGNMCLLIFPPNMTSRTLEGVCLFVWKRRNVIKCSYVHIVTSEILFSPRCDLTRTYPWFLLTTIIAVDLLDSLSLYISIAWYRKDKSAMKNIHWNFIFNLKLMWVIDIRAMLGYYIDLKFQFHLKF